MLTEGDSQEWSRSSPMARRKRRGGQRRKQMVNPKRRGQTRATTKKNKNGKLSVPDMERQKRNTNSTRKKRQLQFAINVRKGKFKNQGRKR